MATVRTPDFAGSKLDPAAPLPLEQAASVRAARASAADEGQREPISQGHACEADLASPGSEDALSRGPGLSHLLGDSLRFEHDALAGNGRRHDRSDRYLLAAKDRVQLHCAGA